MGTRHPYLLDWGSITPEGYIEEENETILVFNHLLNNIGYLDRNIFFIVGRIEWFARHLPENSRISITIDVRGQGIIYDDLLNMKSRILSGINEMLLVKIDFVT